MKEEVTLFGVKSPIGEVQLKRTQPWGRGHFHESQWEGVTQDCWLTLREKSEQRPKLGDPQTPLRSAPSFPSPENQSRAPTCTLQGRGAGASLLSLPTGLSLEHWVGPREEPPELPESLSLPKGSTQGPPRCISLVLDKKTVVPSRFLSFPLLLCWACSWGQGTNFLG